MSTRIGVGVTAIDRRDALQVVAHGVFSDGPLPPLKEIREDLDVSSLHDGHVLQNMRPPRVRGVWFQSGYYTGCSRRPAGRGVRSSAESGRRLRICRGLPERVR